MKLSWSAAKKCPPAIWLLIMVLVAGVSSCKARPVTQIRADKNLRVKSKTKQIFSGAAVPARVQSIDDVAVASVKDRLVIAWVDRLNVGEEAISVVIFNGSGKKVGQADLGQVAKSSNQPGGTAGTNGIFFPNIGFDDGGNIIITWFVGVTRQLVVPSPAPVWRQSDDLFIAEISLSGELLKQATFVDQGIDTFGWRGQTHGWAKVVPQTGGGFLVAWYNANTYSLKGQQLEARYRAGSGPATDGRVKVAAGDDWAVYQGDPSARYRVFAPDAQASGEIVDVPVGARAILGDNNAPIQLDALDIDMDGNVYSLVQIAARTEKETLSAAPRQVRLGKADSSRQIISGQLISNTVVNMSEGNQPSASLAVGSRVINIIWPKTKSRSESTSWLGQFNLEGMTIGPEVEVDKDYGAGLHTTIADKIAVGRSSGADMIVDIFAAGSQIDSLRVAGANQGRVSSEENDLVAVWIGTGSAGQELQVGRWEIGD